MKQFKFPLDRALSWRRTQARLAEAELEKLNAEMAALSLRSQELTTERDQAGRNLLASGAASGVELAFLDSFRKAADAESTRLASACAECRRRIDAQTQVVMERRLGVKALEKLRAKQLDAWRSNLAKELDAQAAESHLARFTALQAR